MVLRVSPFRFVPAFVGLSGAFAAGMALLLAVAPQPQAGAQAARTPDTYSTDDLRRVEAARDAAMQRLRALEARNSAAEREAGEIDADLLAAAADSQNREIAASETEQRLAAMTAEADDAMAQLSADSDTREDLLAALIAFGGRRAPALAASPEDASGAIRAAILMGETAPALSARAGDLRGRIGRLNAAMDGVAREREALDAAEAGLAARRQEIEALAGEKRLARASLAAEAGELRAETERLGAEAQTLRDLLDALTRAAPSRPGERPAATRPGRSTPRASPTPSRTPAANAPGRSTPRSAASATNSASRAASAPTRPQAAGAPTRPTSGRILRRFGQTVDSTRQQGATYATRANAQILSPRDARVEYAGAFRSYGQMLILDVGEDYLVVVSGLDALYPEAGQQVLAGEPIGRMADRASPAPELYLEVRKAGQPIDPEGWLTRGR
jgi:septal ring factor EnvC (AmiA/AmiB activator)